MIIHLVVNISQVVRYREQIEGQKVEEVEPVEIEKINKRKVREVVKYLV